MTVPNAQPKTATKIAKQIIIKTAEMAVPLTPQNFHIWYEYYLGRNKKLITAINALIDAGKSFTADINEKLYTEYLDQGEAEILKQVQEETHRIFQNIFKATLSTSDEAADYSGKMQQYSDKLEAAGDLSHIQKLVLEIIDDTHKMAASSQKLNQKLEAATSQIEDLSKKLEKTEKEGLIDALTGLNNRKAFDRKLKQLCESFARQEDFFSVIMLDIDHFKKFNDQYGHQIGDEVLSLVGWNLKENLKGKDFPCRYGGEEFIVLLPNTEMDKACIVADHIREMIAKKSLKVKNTGQSLGNITVSLGVSQMRREDTGASVIARADAALYLAKDAGRNNVKCETDLESA